MGLGKDRTKLGAWVDRKLGYGGQAKLMEICGIDKNTATRVCAGGSKPNQSTRGRIVQALRQAGHDVYEDDFWA